MALRCAYWGLHRKTDASLEAYKVSAHQYVILELLSLYGPSKQSELVKLASSDPNTIRAMVVTMSKQGLVQRVKHPTDGRAWQVQMTDAARELMPELRERTQDVRNRYVNVMDDEERARLMHLLQKFRDALEDG